MYLTLPTTVECHTFFFYPFREGKDRNFSFLRFFLVDYPGHRKSVSSVGRVPLGCHFFCPLIYGRGGGKGTDKKDYFKFFLGLPFLRVSTSGTSSRTSLCHLTSLPSLTKGSSVIFYESSLRFRKGRRVGRRVNSLITSTMDSCGRKLPPL